MGKPSPYDGQPELWEECSTTFRAYVESVLPTSAVLLAKAEGTRGPKAFDELRHSLLFNVLMRAGMQRAFVAWFIRDLIGTRMHLRFGEYRLAPFSVE